LNCGIAKVASSRRLRKDALKYCEHFIAVFSPSRDFLNAVASSTEGRHRAGRVNSRKNARLVIATNTSINASPGVVSHVGNVALIRISTQTNARRISGAVLVDVNVADGLASSHIGTRGFDTRLASRAFRSIIGTTLRDHTGSGDRLKVNLTVEATSVRAHTAQRGRREAVEA